MFGKLRHSRLSIHHAVAALSCALFVAASLLADPVTLLPNQDFEDAKLGWSAWPGHSQTLVEIDTARAASGAQSLRLTAVSAADRMFPNVGSDAWKPGSIYRLIMSVRKDDSVEWGAISAHINMRGGGEEKKSGRVLPAMVTRVPNGEWTTWTGYFELTDWLETGQLCLGLQYAVGRFPGPVPLDLGRLLSTTTCRDGAAARSEAI